MATRYIVPREDGEGGLGRESKRWGEVNANEIKAEDIVASNIDVSEVSADTVDASEINAGAVNVAVNEIIKSSTATLTTAEVKGTIINNYGQIKNITLTLPTAAKGLTFMVVLGTTATDKYFRIKAGTNDQIYLSGTGGGDNKYVGVASAKVGYAISFSSFQTGENTYDWLAIPIVGNWVAES